MSLRRAALFSIGLFLLALLGVGLYLYLQFPAFVERQARQQLQDIGVERVKYGHLKITWENLKTDTLELHGEYDGLAYQATISSLEILYDWRMLLAGQVISVKIGDLVLTLSENPGQQDSSSADTVTVSALLPGPYLEYLPFESINIQRWKVDYRPLSGLPVLATGQLQLAEQLSIQGQTSYLERDIAFKLTTEGDNADPRADIRLFDSGTAIAALSVDIVPADAEDRWRWSVTAQLDYEPLLMWLQQSNPIWQLPLDVAVLEGLTLKGGSTVTATIEHSDVVLLNNDDWSAQFSIEAHTENRLSELLYPGVASDLHASFDLALALIDEQITLTLGATQLTGNLHTELLSLPRETQNWLRWGQTVPIVWKNSGKVIMRNIDEAGWSLQLHDNSLSLGDRNSESRWSAISFNAAVFPGEVFSLEADLRARVSMHLRKKQLPEMRLQYTHTGSLAQSEFNLALEDIAESMQLKLSGEANLETGKGSYLANIASLDLPYATSTLWPLLRGFGILDKTQNIKFSSGTFNLESQLQSCDFSLAGLSVQSQLKIGSLTGVYDEYHFSGLAMVADWSGIEQWQTRRPVEISIASMDLGFALTDTRARLSLPRATPLDLALVNIEAFSSGVFGGSVFLPESGQWDIGAKTNHFTLRAEGWKLAEIVALQQGQDIQAHGEMEGELPLTVTGGRVIIENGYLQAIPPGGNIRYIADEASKALAASSPELELAINLLSDFHYEVLSSQVELDQGGNLWLGLSLSGKNPAHYDGRAIKFNINVEQNLDPLLQSLRLSDKLVEKVEDHIN